MAPRSLCLRIIGSSSEPNKVNSCTQLWSASYYNASISDKKRKRDVMDYCEKMFWTNLQPPVLLWVEEKRVKNKKERIALLRNNLILYLAYQYTNYRVEQPNKQSYRSNRLDPPSNCSHLHICVAHSGDAQFSFLFFSAQLLLL
jgi:hypothetical protein